MNLTLLLLIIPIMIFLLLFAFRRRTMWIGLFFILSVVSSFTLMFMYLEPDYHEKLFVLLIIPAAFAIVLIPFYVLSFAIALIGSGLQLMKREGRRLRNFLSLVLGMFILVWPVVISFISVDETQPLLFSLVFFLTTLVSYFYFLMICFGIAALFNQFRNPFKSYHYIIVLGSGLIGERVPPLLASRIDKGIQLFQKHNSKVHPVKIVFTGGQGSDEAIAEGVAMAKYARENGLEEEHIIIEDKAVNTYENLLFSKRLIEEDRALHDKDKKTNIILTTNNFHVFRSLLWARKVGMKCDGAGSKTKFYFWLNALIREFIGVLYMHRRFHLFMLVFLTIVSISMFFLNKYAVLPFKPSS